MSCDTSGQALEKTSVYIALSSLFTSDGHVNVKVCDACAGGLNHQHTIISAVHPIIVPLHILASCHQLWIKADCLEYSHSAFRLGSISHVLESITALKSTVTPLDKQVPST